MLAFSLDTGGTVLAGGIGILLFTISFTLLRSVVSINRRSIKEFVIQAQQDIKQLRRSGRLCDKRLAIVVRVLQQHRIPVPESIWDTPEQEDRMEHPDDYSDNPATTRARNRRPGGRTGEQK